MKIGTDGVLLGAWCPLPAPGASIVDAGAGCGLIALMLAQRMEGNCHVTAVEIDPQACQDARDNVIQSPWPNSVEVACQDYLERDFRADLIVSNPPFFAPTALSSPDEGRCRARKEHSLTLATLISHSAKILNLFTGAMALILPSERDEECLYQATLARLHPRQQFHVISVEGHAPKRTLWYLTRQEGPLTHSTLTLRLSDGTYTNEYRALTRDFYL